MTCYSVQASICPQTVFILRIQQANHCVIQMIVTVSAKWSLHVLPVFQNSHSTCIDRVCESKQLLLNGCLSVHMSALQLT